MHFLATILTLLLLALADEHGPALTKDSPIDDVLHALDARGKSLVTLQADVELTEEDLTTGRSPTRSGQFWIDRREPGTKLRVEFSRVRDDRKIKLERVEYILVGDWLVERDYQLSKETRRQVRAPDEATDILRLGEGPFPLPIGQSPESVHAQFEIQKIDTAEDAPPDSIALKLIPKADTNLAGRFSWIEFHVDPASCMPVMIVSKDKSQPVITTTKLNNIVINQPVDAAKFDITPDPATWEIITTRLTEGQ